MSTTIQTTTIDDLDVFDNLGEVFTAGPTTEAWLETMSAEMTTAPRSPPGCTGSGDWPRCMAGVYEGRPPFCEVPQAVGRPSQAARSAGIGSPATSQVSPKSIVDRVDGS
jgi:hypothetical protein